MITNIQLLQRKIRDGQLSTNDLNIIVNAIVEASKSQEEDGGNGTAISTSFTPIGDIVSTNVQQAIAELDTKKASVISLSYLPKVFNVENYGAVHDGVTDDTTAIQSTIQACFDAGGGTVYFPNGVYIIGGPLITSLDGVNPNCQIYIPKREKNLATNLISIKILGESVPAVFGTILNNNAGVINTGVILKSTILGSGTRPRVFGTSFYFTGFVDTNSTHVIFENIRIRVRSKTSGTDIAPTMTAFGAQYIEAVEFYNCLADTETNSWSSVQPANDNVIGFEMPAQASQDRMTLWNCMAKNFYIGFEINEHAVANGLRADSCFYGYKFFGFGTGHPSYAGRLYTNGCKYGLVFDTAPSVIIDQYVSEREALGRWYDGTADFLSLNLTNNARGIVNYSIWSNADKLDAPPVFSGTFDGYIQFRNLRTVGAIYDPTGSTNFGNGQPFEQLRYNGAPVSTDQHQPIFQFTHRQNGTANLISQFQFVNEQSADTDKRLMAWSIRTNGALDKGMWRTSINNGTTITLVEEMTTDYHKIMVPAVLPSYTVATVPSASTSGPGALVYITNEIGGATVAYSNGTNWKRIRDDVNISA